MSLILDKLITMTIDEEEMYPSIQAKIWGNIGQVSDLLDMVLDSFIKVCQLGTVFLDNKRFRSATRKRFKMKSFPVVISFQLFR